MMKSEWLKSDAAKMIYFRVGVWSPLAAAESKNSSGSKSSTMKTDQNFQVPNG